MLTSSISNTKWCHSVGESCDFMNSYVFNVGLADVIANDFRQFMLFLADVIPILPLVFQLRFCLADVIAMLLGYMMDGDVITIRLML